MEKNDIIQEERLRNHVRRAIKYCKKRHFEILVILIGILVSLVQQFASLGYNDYYGFESIFLKLDVFNLGFLITSMIIIVISFFGLKWIFPYSSGNDDDIKYILAHVIYYYDILLIFLLTSLCMSLFTTLQIELIVCISCAITVVFYLFFNNIIKYYLIKNQFNTIKERYSYICKYYIKLLCILLLFSPFFYSLELMLSVIVLLLISTFVYKKIMINDNKKLTNNFSKFANISVDSLLPTNKMLTVICALFFLVLAITFIIWVRSIGYNYAANTNEHHILERKDEDKNVVCYLLMESVSGKSILMDLEVTNENVYLVHTYHYKYYEIIESDNIRIKNCIIQPKTGDDIGVLMKEIANRMYEENINERD